jgi:hypothetical protein
MLAHSSNAIAMLTALPCCWRKTKTSPNFLNSPSYFLPLLFYDPECRELPQIDLVERDTVRRP